MSFISNTNPFLDHEVVNYRPQTPAFGASEPLAVADRDSEQPVEQTALLTGDGDWWMNSCLLCYERAVKGNFKNKEEKFSRKIVNSLTVKRFTVVVPFLKDIVSKKIQNPINKIILLGLSRFVFSTISKDELYLNPREAYLAPVGNELITIYDFFVNEKELLTEKLIAFFSFGFEEYKFDHSFVGYFNYSFSRFVKQLKFNVDGCQYFKILESLVQCPKLKSIQFRFNINIFTDSNFSSSNEVVEKRMKEILSNLKKSLAKFPLLQEIYFLVSVSCRGLYTENREKLVKKLNDQCETYYYENNPQLPSEFDNTYMELNFC